MKRDYRGTRLAAKSLLKLESREELMGVLNSGDNDGGYEKYFRFWIYFEDRVNNSPQ